MNHVQRLMALRQRGLPRHWLSDHLLRRVFENAGTLFTGHALAGLLGLGAIAVSARALGSEAFGVMILIHSYAVVVSNLTSFKAWHAVIRYGAICVHEDRRDDFRSLVGFALLLDFGSACIAVLLAILAAPWLGPLIGWPQEVVAAGQWYALVILFMGTGTPIGILRLFDRFRLAAAQELVMPGVRLAGALVAYLIGAELPLFLAIWFAGAAFDGVSLWLLAARELRRRGYLSGGSPRLRGLNRMHPGLWRLVWTTNLTNTLGLVTGRFGTLIIGAIVGAAGAGLYHVAAQFASALERPVEMLRRTIYPEFARLHAAADLRAMRRLALRAALTMGGVAAPILLALAALAEPVLRLTVGAEFASAHAILSLLIGALVVTMFGFPAHSLLIAQGRPGIVLTINAATTAIHVGLLVSLLSVMGLIGAGVAAAARAVLTVVLTAIVAARTLRHAIAAQPRSQT